MAKHQWGSSLPPFPYLLCLPPTMTQGKTQALGWMERMILWARKSELVVVSSFISCMTLGEILKAPKQPFCHLGKKSNSKRTITEVSSASNSKSIQIDYLLSLLNSKQIKKELNITQMSVTVINNVEWRKPDKKDYVLYDSICVKFNNRQK